MVADHAPNMLVRLRTDTGLSGWGEGSPLHSIVGETQAIAHAVCRQFRARFMHLGFPHQYNNSGNLAMLFSPAVVSMGEVYEFSVYHLLRLKSPTEIFPIDYFEVGSLVPQGVA